MVDAHIHERRPPVAHQEMAGVEPRAHVAGVNRGDTVVEIPERGDVVHAAQSVGNDRIVALQLGHFGVQIVMIAVHDASPGELPRFEPAGISHMHHAVDFRCVGEAARQRLAVRDAVHQHRQFTANETPEALATDVRLQFHPC